MWKRNGNVLTRIRLAEKTSAARVYRLHLSRINREALETVGELAAVEEDARGGLDGAELSASNAADALLLDCLLEGAKLLGVVPVGAEGGVLGASGGVAVAKALGESPRGGSRVRLGSVVNGSYCFAFVSVLLS